MEKKWKHPPQICQWDITSRCNLECLHCRATGSWEKTEDLSFSTVKSILQQFIAFAPNSYLALAGGEPLLRKDLKDILVWFRKEKSSIRVELLTNGTLIDKANISWLRDSVNGFNVGLEGKREANDAVRGKGSFDKAIKGISLLVENGLKVAVRMTFFHQKEDEVENLMRLLKEIGVGFFNFRYVVPVGRAQHAAVSAQQYKRLTLRIRELGKGLDMMVGFSDPFPDFLTDCFLKRKHDSDRELMEGKAVTGCSIAFNLLYIDPEGIVKACPYFPVVIADAKKEPLYKIWFKNKTLGMLRNIRSCLKGRCGVCKYKFACGGCRGAALAGGDFLGEDSRCWLVQSLE